MYGARLLQSRYSMSRLRLQPVGGATPEALVATTQIGPRKIAVGDLGDFWYGNYKEPFEQLEGGIPGHPVGVVLKDDDGKLLCAYCGKTFDFLPRHITAAHGMRTREYKREVGLLQKSALVSERVRASRIRTALRNRAGGKWAANEAVSGPRIALVRGTRKNNPEELNKTGRCYAQILAVARQVVREDGRVTIARMAKRGIWQRNIEAMFGSLFNLARLAGDGRHIGRWTDAELINALRALGSEIGRTPVTSDLRRYGLPTFHTYIKRFGSYMTACERAGLEPFRWVPRDAASEAAYLLAWATSGDVLKAGAACGTAARTIRQTLTKYGIPQMPPGGGHHAMRQAAREQAARVAARIEGVAAA